MSIHWLAFFLLFAVFVVCSEAEDTLDDPDDHGRLSSFLSRRRSYSTRRRYTFYRRRTIFRRRFINRRRVTTRRYWPNSRRRFNFRRRRYITSRRRMRTCWLSAWSAWSACSENCQVGTQTRSRTLTGGPSTYCRRPVLQQQQDCGEQNGGCQEMCTNGICSCRQGYMLLNDGKRCQDINECQPNGGRGPCSHVCHNSAGSYSCSCPNEYRMGSDGKTCRLKDCGAPFFSHCYTPIYTDHLGEVCQKVAVTCSSGTVVNSQCQFNCPANFAVAKLNDFSLPFAKHVRTSDFHNVITSTKCGLDSVGNPVWSDSAQYSSHYFCRRTNDPPSNILLSKNTLKEHSPKGSVVGTLSVVIPNVDSSVTYSMQQSAGQYFFQLRGNNVVNTWIPRWNNLQGLEINNYHIKVRATAGGNPPMSMDKNFTITVVNVNDPPYSIRITNDSVLDTATHGYVVGVLSAIDYDGPRGKLPSSDFIWNLIDDDRGRFALQGAKVVVAGALDHTAHQYHRIIVNCTDKDSQDPRWSQTSIVINVINTNDSPKNVRLQTFNFYENASVGFVAGEFIAYDEDGDALTFSLSQSDSETLQTFELGQTCCVNTTIKSIQHSICKASLILKKSVDYEVKHSYSIKIAVTDPSGGVNIKDFMLHVINLNEAPTDITLSRDTVPENSPVNTVVGQLTITDPDTSQLSPQGHICTATPSTPFSISGFNLIVSGSLDYEMKSTYRVNITCTDTGAPPLSLWRVFVIKVQDQNERPEYLTLTRSFIQENAKVGITVGEFLSRDPDGHLTALTFHIKSPVNSPFTIAGPRNSSLVTTRPLDYETQNEFDLLVSVTDSGGLSLEKYFKIKIIDVNEAPTDIVLSPLTIPENSPPGTWVGSITVLDPDINSTASCRIVDGNTDYFAISAMHLVAGNKKIDYEALGSSKSLNVKLSCADAFGLTIEKVFHISVTDVNEAPTDVQVTLHSVPENQINAPVGQLTVQDPDISQSHSCEVVANDTGSLLFAIDKKSLTLKTRRPLNFEQVRQHRLTIRCSDNVGSNQSHFTIFKDVTFDVVDVNESPFNPCPRQIYVDEAASSGSVIWTFHPRDPDNEEYEMEMRRNISSAQPKQSLLVGLSGSGAGLPFQVVDDQYLVKNGKFDRAKQSVYNVPVNVTDDGMLLRLVNGKYQIYQGHKVSSTYNCKVEVLASGDQRLALDIALSSNTISEDALNGTKVGTISMVNKKHGITYRLRVMQSDVAPFRISGNDLILVVGDSLDYERTNATGVGIIAVGSDGSTVQRLFIIRITNVNEKPTKMCVLGPKTVRSLIQTDQFVGQIYIEDPDHKESRGICSKVSPTLTQAQNYKCQIDSNVINVAEMRKIFYIDGRLKLHGNTTFNYLVKSQYSVPIICRDIHKPVHLIQTTIKVNVKAQSCQSGYKLVNGICVCANGMSGPKCDRDPYICAKTTCGKTEVCVSHIGAPKRCIPRSNQVPILMQLPYSIISRVENRYKVEGYVESIFEGTRTAGQTLESLFSDNVISRRRRDIPKDVYVEAAKSQKVLSFYSYVIFVAMDPQSSYKALPGSNMCALLTGTDLRCVNEEDCKLLAKAGIECPYSFPDMGKSGKRNSGNDDSSGAKPWAIGVGAVAVICVVLIVLVFFVLKRRARSRPKSDTPVIFHELDDSAVNGLANPLYSGESVSPDSSPQVIPGKRGLQLLVNNNRTNPKSAKKPTNVKTFENVLYDEGRQGAQGLNNPVYGASSFLPPPQTDEHLYESVGKKLGKDAVNMLIEEEKKRAIEKGFDGDVVSLPKVPSKRQQEPEYSSAEKPDNRRILSEEERRTKDKGLDSNIPLPPKVPSRRRQEPPYASAEKPNNKRGLSEEERRAKEKGLDFDLPLPPKVPSRRRQEPPYSSAEKPDNRSVLNEEKRRAKEKGFDADVVSLPKEKNRKWGDPEYASTEKQDRTEGVNVQRPKKNDSNC